MITFLYQIWVHLISLDRQKGGLAVWKYQEFSVNQPLLKTFTSTSQSSRNFWLKYCTVEAKAFCIAFTCGTPKDSTFSLNLYSPTVFLFWVCSCGVGSRCSRWVQVVHGKFVPADTPGRQHRTVQSPFGRQEHIHNEWCCKHRQKYQHCLFSRDLGILDFVGQSPLLTLFLGLGVIFKYPSLISSDYLTYPASAVPSSAGQQILAYVILDYCTCFYSWVRNFGPSLYTNLSHF